MELSGFLDHAAGLFLPAIGEAALAAVLPLLMMRRMGRSRGMRAVIFAICALVLFVTAMAAFVLLNGGPAAEWTVVQLNPRQALWTLARSAALSALIWGPVLLLSVTSRGRHVY